MDSCKLKMTKQIIILSSTVTCWWFSVAPLTLKCFISVFHALVSASCGKKEHETCIFFYVMRCRILIAEDLKRLSEIFFHSSGESKSSMIPRLSEKCSLHAGLKRYPEEFSCKQGKVIFMFCVCPRCQINTMNTYRTATTIVMNDWLFSRLIVLSRKLWKMLIECLYLSIRQCKTQRYPVSKKIYTKMTDQLDADSFPANPLID